VPQHDVLVVEVCVWVCGDPGGDALGGLAGGLGDVAAGGVELVVFVWMEAWGVSGVDQVVREGWWMEGCCWMEGWMGAYIW